MSVYAEIARNKQRTWLIVGLFASFTAAVVYVLLAAMGYGADALLLAIGFSSLATGFSYWNSDKIVLAISGARPADRQRDFNFYTVTENLCLGARLPLPKLYVIEDTAMNAFATGRDPEHAVVCATTGLLARLDRTELEGVVAHELAHIKNYDIRLMTVVSVMVGLLALLADFFLRWSHWGGGRRQRDNDNGGNQAQVILLVVGLILAMLSPLVAQLIQLAISRNREFLADATGAKLTGYPAGLASALRKLSADREPLEAANKATAHLYIVNPLHLHHDAIGWFASLFQTHPPIAERIRRLQGM